MEGYGDGEKTRLIVEANSSPRRERVEALKPVGPIFLSIILLGIIVGILYFTGITTSSNVELTPEVVNPDLHLRWGIAGLGRISSDFSVALRIIGADFEAVAAGALPDAKNRAVDFGQKFGLPVSKCYGTYEELAADPNIDIVYIGNTNQLHYKTTMLMIEAGKHVLVEKPTAMNAQETRNMIFAARAKGVFFMTNFWTRFFPAIRFARGQMKAGCIGDIVGVRGDFGFQAQPDPNDRYFNSITGGGALLDMGCYLIHFATMAMDAVWEYKDTLRHISTAPPSSSLINDGDRRSHDGVITQPFRVPDSIVAKGLVGSNGVDIESSFVLTWNSDLEAVAVTNSTDKTATEVSPDTMDLLMSSQRDTLKFRGLSTTFSTSLRRGSPFSVEIMGTHGFINIDNPANCPVRSTVNVGGDAYRRKTSLDPMEFQSPTEEICLKNSIGPNVFQENLPIRPAQYGPQAYPGTTGFVYVIETIDKCIRDATLSKSSTAVTNCLELPEFTSEEQILIMETVDSIRQKMVT